MVSGLIDFSPAHDFRRNLLYTPNSQKLHPRKLTAETWKHPWTEEETQRPKPPVLGYKNGKFSKVKTAFVHLKLFPPEGHIDPKTTKFWGSKSRERLTQGEEKTHPSWNSLPPTLGILPKWSTLRIIWPSNGRVSTCIAGVGSSK